MYNKREIYCDYIISTGGGDSKATPSFNYPVKYKALDLCGKKIQIFTC